MRRRIERREGKKKNRTGQKMQEKKDQTENQIKK
jgi:hypothetical protein